MGVAGPSGSVFIGLLGAILIAGTAAANNRQKILLLCESEWPKQAEQRRACEERQTTSAETLLKRIEGASDTSIEFAIAKSCIERAKSKPQSKMASKTTATIDWDQALTCFEKRDSAIAPSDTP